MRERYNSILKEKGVEGGRELYKFPWDVESLKVNEAVMTGKEEMRKMIREFRVEIGGAGEIPDVRERVFNFGDRECRGVK